jgi:type IV pilus assembly protein PilW
LVAGGTTPVAIASGVYGCSGKLVKDDFSGCDDNDEYYGAPNSDSLSLSYFTSDAFSRDVGTRADCGRADVAHDDAYNAEARIGSATKNSTTASGAPPSAPLLGVNQFLLQPLKYIDNTGKSVDTYQLSCRGNGNGMGTVPLVPGVVQMTFRYGVITDGTGAPTRYMTADEINTSATGAVVVGDAKLAGWARVASVRVCVVVRSLNAAVSSVAGQATADCLGNDITPDPGAVYQTFTQVFGVKNRNQNTVGL